MSTHNHPIPTAYNAPRCIRLTSGDLTVLLIVIAGCLTCGVNNYNEAQVERECLKGGHPPGECRAM